MVSNIAAIPAGPKTRSRHRIHSPMHGTESWNGLSILLVEGMGLVRQQAPNDCLFALLAEHDATVEEGEASGELKDVGLVAYKDVCHAGPIFQCHGPAPLD